MQKILIFSFVLFLLSSCYRSTKLIGITAYNCNIYKYEIQIKTHTEGRGSIHNPFDLTKYELDDYEWIYVNSIKGQVPSDSIAFTYEQRRIKYPWRKTNLYGYIGFSNDSIFIDLHFYDREDTTRNDLPYTYNGKYKLKVINDTITRFEKF